MRLCGQYQWPLSNDAFLNDTTRTAGHPVEINRDERGLTYRREHPFWKCRPGCAGHLLPRKLQVLHVSADSLTAGLPWSTCEAKCRYGGLTQADPAVVVAC
jgi:hypothetical protein